MLFDSINELLKGPIYESTSDQRQERLLQILRELMRHHITKCPPYGKLCEKRGIVPERINTFDDLPYLPTSIFKDKLLLSIPEDEVFRELRSSATTSGRPSRIGLDKENNRRWTVSLQRMLLERIGNVRYQFIILDAPSVLKGSSVISARMSMTRSLLFCSSGADTCLNEESGGLSLDMGKFELLVKSAQKQGEGLIIFGFTFILYFYLIRALLDAGKSFDLSKAKIIHAGGWKKLEAQKVDNEKLLNDCNLALGVSKQNVIDLYGFTEQGGMLFPTCEEGFRHTPAWGEVICRDPISLKTLAKGNAGLMQFVTPIQTAYPGHSIITEDMGFIQGYDDCPCGRNGTVFKIIGRAAATTEDRGCGDIMAEQFA